MTTPGQEEAKRALRGSIHENRSQVLVAEETLRLLRDGDRLNEQVRKELEGEEPPKNTGGGMEQRVINALVAIVMAFICWWCNNIWNAVQAQQQQITQLNVELARNYVPRVELQAHFDKIETQLEHIIQNQKEARR